MTALAYLISFLVLIAIFWAVVMWIVARRFKRVLKENIVLREQLRKERDLRRMSQGHNARFATAIRTHRSIVFHPGASPAQSDLDLWSALDAPKEAK